MADSNTQAAAHDEQWIEVAPPSYKQAASVASEGDLYYATPQHTGWNERASTLPDTKDRLEHVDVSPDTAAESKPREIDEAAVWYKQAALSEVPALPTKEPLEACVVTTSEPDERTAALPVGPSFDDEKLALQLQRGEEERPMAHPTRKHHHASLEARDDLSYTFSWRRPLTGHPILTVTGRHSAANASRWRLNYQSKYFARLHRYQSDQARVDGDFPARQVAGIEYPEYILPGCGLSITFEPHEDAIYRKGSAHAQRVNESMKCSGWLTTRYTLALPVLEGARCTWRPVQSTQKEWQPEPVGHEQAQQVTTGDILAQAKRYMNDDTWTPYPTQQLIAEDSGIVIATYDRATPWARDAGILHIVRPDGIQTMAEYIEGIMIATVAMVGMQDRTGLASSLMQASAARVMACRKTEQGQTNVTLSKSETAGIRISPTDESSLQRRPSPSDLAPTERVDLPQRDVVLDAEGYEENKIQRSLRRLSEHLAVKSEAMVPQHRGQRVVLDEKV